MFWELKNKGEYPILEWRFLFLSTEVVDGEGGEKQTQLEKRYWHREHQRFSIAPCHFPFVSFS